MAQAVDRGHSAGEFIEQKTLKLPGGFGNSANSPRRRKVAPGE
jgi:hypothetical protein